MPRRVRLVALVLLTLLLVAVATVLGVRSWRSAHRTDLQTAMAMAPASAERFSFTDWAAVRSELGADLDPSSPYDDVSAFLDDAFDRDLSSTSAMVASAQVLHEKLGFSPASVDWELFSQGTTGAALTLRLPDSLDIDDIGDSLEGLGYARPDTDTGVWDGGEEVVAEVSAGVGLSPEYQYLALDAADHLVVASDRSDYAQVAMRAATGDGDSVTGLDDVVAAVGDPLSAAVYTGDDACRELAMSQADDSDQAQAKALVAESGKVNPLSGFAMGSQASGRVLVSMGFENDDQARTNADTRARLAKGPAVGQGGDFADRFRLRRTSAEGSVVVMDLQPRSGTFVLSDLSTGPVLYATC